LTLVDFAIRTDELKIGYHALTTNSNAFAHQAVTVLGIDRPTPYDPGVLGHEPGTFTAPGHDTVLSGLPH
jgi:hypothetical protein